MSKFDRLLKYSILKLILNLVLAFALAEIIGNSPDIMAKIYVLLNLNVFSLPLLLTDVFMLPTWAWFVIIVEWIGTLIGIKQYIVEAENE